MAANRISISVPIHIEEERVPLGAVGGPGLKRHGQPVGSTTLAVATTSSVTDVLDGGSTGIAMVFVLTKGAMER
jgi:hypothetical protein